VYLYNSVKGKPLFDVFENKDLKRIFGSKRDEIIRSWRKFYYDDDRLCGLVVRVPGFRSRGPGSILDATRFSEK
jgi:hypothetical protein